MKYLDYGFRDLIQYNLVDRYQHFVGTCCLQSVPAWNGVTRDLHLPENSRQTCQLAGLWKMCFGIQKG
jgi:hypothetical protein